MRFEWDEAKRKSNLKTHSLDFADAKLVFSALTASYEDDRFRYAEQRFVTLGLLRGPPVSIVHTESCIPSRRTSFVSFLFVGRQIMKQRSSSKPSRTISRRRTAPKPIKVTEEHPELDPKHVVRVIVRNGLRPVLPKTTISLRVDADVLEWFKAAGPGYQTRINAVLRAYKEASV
jgi:uncharacterized protein (DUF4415 family)